MTNGRDRLRELLDAVLDEGNMTLGEMASDVYASPYHFARQVAKGAGEAPVAMRRRVLLERAAWQLSNGDSVTDVAWAAGYDSVEGFSRAYSRAFGHPPSATPARPKTRWLPAVNGIHFHPPMSLWLEGEPRGRPDMDPTSVLVHHDLDDTRELLRLARGLDEQSYRRRRGTGTVLAWDGPEDSIATVLDLLIWTKEVWLASIEGSDQPERQPDDLPTLTRRLDEVAPRWLDTVREIDRRRGWGDRLIDALCEPPESFVLGSVLAHILTYSAYRRLLARQWLRAELPTDAVEQGDPIMWLRRREHP
ncbi:helix-turn-helix domain-containing protein [Nocardia sp. CDC159]|uniref:Helix-turn-helix domain-containing protein n=1 Tax=Nocardia pulmonis TaxID=2951408 RepID=A0A9X2ECC0_9NOCA|nr:MULTISPECIES: helix-turn-helix domain-containing protein [Nocardia]MCM6778112.1 helix-turn-helix domain-containing protein [Nocardia pulmonis]MCM6791001.1 helix-turn-helix domain-containing protein [Nocardia sp. CDC159]